MVGRRAERDRISALATTPTERGLLIIGGPGSGKTRLLETAASESPIRAVLVRTNPREADLPFSGLSAMFSSIGDLRALEFSNRVAARSSEPREIFAAARDVLALLRELRLSPHLVLIDDADLMDAESRLLIGFMAGRLAGTNVRLVLAAGSNESSAAFGGYETLHLAPLPDEEARELVTGIVGPAAEGTLRILASRSGGIPSAIVDYARALSDAQAWGLQPLVLPFKIGARPGALDVLVPEHARPTLDVIALGPLACPAALALLDATHADNIDSLVESDLVVVRGRHIAITEPQLRSRLYWAMDAADRRRLHAELATAYVGVSQPLAAWHGSFATPHDDSQVRAVLTAAVELARSGERDAAVDFAERALRLSTSVDDFVAPLLDLAEAFLTRGELELASRYVDYTRQASAHVGWSVRQATLALTIVYARTWIVPDIDIETTAEVHAGEDPSGAARLVDLAAVCHAVRWEFDVASELMDQAERIVAMTGTVAPTLHDHARDLLRALAGGDDAAGDDSPAIDVADAPFEELLTHGLALSHRERFDRARRLFAHAAARAHAEAPIWHETALQLAVGNELAAGNVRLGRMLVQEWSRIALPQVAPRASRALLRAWDAAMGDEQDAFAALSLECRERAATENNRAVEGTLSALQGSLALIDRDVEEALRSLELADRVDAPNPALLRHAADLVEAQVSLGRTADARRVRDRLMSRATSHPSRWLRLALARIAANLASDHDRAAAFQACIDLYGPADSPFELAKTLANLAHRLDDAGALDESKTAYDVARAAFERAGAPSLGRKLMRAGEEDSTPAAASITALLTNEERQIADLVCQGLRNKEIAAVMYLSLRSVEAKLTIIYRKVNARTRSHLVAMLTEVAR